MIGLPERSEAAPYYFTYIDRIPGTNIVSVLEKQLNETSAFLSGISEEQSLHRYAPDKWSFRQVLNHLNDTERMMLFRAFWFARNFDSPLPSFDQNIAVGAARADDYSWTTHLHEFGAVRQATLTFFRNLPDEAWLRKGIASDNPFTVRALAYLIAGHVSHHLAIVKERYL
jgi:hypothetical protein